MRITLFGVATLLRQGVLLAIAFGITMETPRFANKIGKWRVKNGEKIIRIYSESQAALETILRLRVSSALVQDDRDAL